MCGICGWINRSFTQNVERSTLERMNATLAHRGPDDTGSVIFENAALAMSRLSVIDLTTGHQPISNEDETCWIVYNGEIYNFLDLRRELEARGHRFRTRSDAEVTLHAYEEWGLDCVHRLRGMFAFAIYDLGSRAPQHPSTPALFLARDRVGKKPLYYYQDSEHFIFASEIKAILAHPVVPRRVNRHVIPLYLGYGYVPAPNTMFEHIYELLPGHTLTVQDGQIKIQEYWDVTYPHYHDFHLSEQETVIQLRELLKEAIHLRLISDVPLGAFLSGGIDSTAVVALMTQLTDHPVKTFSIGFQDDPSFNELEYARLVARAYDTDHHEFVVRPNAVDLLNKLVWHYDQPFADSSAIPTYLVSQLTREHVTVALTGDGGDELFAGYDRFAAARLAETYRRTPQFVQTALAHLFRALPESTSYNGFVRRARRFVENAPLPLAQRYLGWVGIFQNGFIRELLNDENDADPGGHFQGYFDRVQEVDPIGQLLYVNTKTYLPGDLLVKTDRMTMANSLEARCPFLDQELVEFAARIPTDLKLRGLTKKYILKEALKGIVPREIIHRKKHGFGVPVGRWFQNELKDYLREILLSSQALRRGYFKEETLRRLIDEHQSGRREHGHRLWALLTFEMWHRVFIDRNTNS
ncbi:MAG: asparagine synthase (glutamine-hydrolyzing) [Deltaproteobacteria bacterium RBG_13_53_10]|nr:MAG: asparagine synthase (glutamine-hydrolyzing) [Deltaproteobacteria bacterium RBG_13_53_10]